MLGGCQKPESTRLDEQPLPHVRVATVVEVTPRPQSRHLVLLEPARRARLSPRMGGQVVSLEVDEQQTVIAGDVLVRLAAADSRGGLISAKASMTRIKERIRDNERELATIRDLARRGAETTRAVERLETEQATLKAQLREAQGQVVRARDAVGAATIDAPFSGTVTRIDTEVGEYINPGSVALVIAQLDPLAAEVPLSEAEIAQNDEASLSFSLTIRGHTVEPKIEWIAREAEVGTSTFTARLQLDNANGRLRAGESAEVAVFGPNRAPVNAVPMTAVRYAADVSYVLRLAGDKVERVSVTVLDDSEDLVVIEGAIQRGQRVVAAGPVSLMPGDQVVVVDEPAQTLAQGETAGSRSG